jgi:hypothetical protein|tara:strand:- start:1328 stop:1528 length:201 start_codon:yes stop_codon:yes gene_type:complete
MKHRKVDGYEGLVKDERGVVLNTSTEEIRAARARKKAWKKKQEEIDDLKQDVSDLKDMMKQILEKL